MADSENRPSPLFVILAGLATTAATLGGVYWLDTHTESFHVMGWYANYILPIGAMLVGTAAGTGYGVASWVTGLKIKRALLLLVVLLQFGAYFAAEWVEYRGVMSDMAAELKEKGLPTEASVEPISFTEYFHLRTTSFRWNNHGKPGDALGNWGYAFVGLALVGFVLGGLAIPAATMFIPYCDDCTRYMKTKSLGVLAGSAPYKKIGKKDVTGQAAYAEASAQVAREMQAKLERISELAAKQDSFRLKEELPSQTRGERAKLQKLPMRLAINLVHCPGCRKSHLQPIMVTGQGNSIRQNKLAPLASGPEIVRAFVN